MQRGKSWTKEIIKIPAKKVPKFLLGKNLREKIFKEIKDGKVSKR